jgi:hypothetical protein
MSFAALTLFGSLMARIVQAGGKTSIDSPVFDPEDFGVSVSTGFDPEVHSARAQTRRERVDMSQSNAEPPS